ncbi:Arachidonate 15-lipoxygenase [Apiospora phragmitis]|uniref:Manganese lipoxygenase n=1 Tax=Apiospora phragmitis TaxID=2905665 RepID=A0ABR1VQX1_9PEZI
MGSTLSTLRRQQRSQKDHGIVGELDSRLPKPSPEKRLLDPRKLLRHPDEKDVLKSIVSIRHAPLQDFDAGVLSEELLNLKIFDIVDHTATSGPNSTRYIDLSEKREMYQWSSYPTGEDGKPAAFSPHLQTIPKADDVSLWKLFNNLAILESQVIVQKVIPDTFLGKTADWILEKVRCAIEGTPEKGVTINDVEEYNKWHRKSGTDIARGENIGHLDDWFSDRRFADQSLTGANPTTITRASPGLIKEFVEAARANGYDKWAETLLKVDPASLLVQDCSYFREAFGVAADDVLHHKRPASDDNWGCASVTLYRLHPDGKLHPIAIVIDYKGTMANSVTIFNKRMSPSDSTRGEATDWPWRYAKTCAQVSDWFRHEITVHLTNSHFVEEAVIVATNRTIPMEHIVYKLLHPHWYKTLSLNAAGRASLVPQIMYDVVSASPEQASSYLRHAFEHFDFQGNYVPSQLRDRGFPSDPAGLEDPKYKNYPYAKNMTLMWTVIRKYVCSMLLTYYDQPRADQMVAEDRYVADWCLEVQEAGHIQTFPTIRTFDQLIDAVTMCIHLAAPFHTAVNYLQNFYQAFVIAKPSCLCARPPATLAELRQYTERDLVAALPINRQRQWMLESIVPWLLSSRVGADRSLLNFALSQWSVYRRKTGPKEVEVRDVSEMFYLDLCRLAKLFYYNSKAMDEGAIPYMVMDPGMTAVSILI